MEDKNKFVCERCFGVQVEEIVPHLCPYAMELGGDYETLCNCCEECECQCAMDI